MSNATPQTKYTLVWGFLMNQSHQVSEKFEGAEGRKAAWARVQEIMSKRGCPRNYGPSHPVCLLQVYSAAPDGSRRCASFKPHVEGSRFIQWTDSHGQGWAVDEYGLSRESFG
jgi:hypothetical protein